MKGMVRRLRGLLGVGLTWGVLWGGIGAIVGFIVGMVDPGAWTLANPIVEWALGMGAYGVVSGLGFGTLLSVGEGRKALRELSLRRVAVWGVLGAAAVPLLFGATGFFEAGTTLVDVLEAMGLTAMLGGTFAPGAVAIARRAELATGEAPPLLEEGR